MIAIYDNREQLFKYLMERVIVAFPCTGFGRSQCEVIYVHFILLCSKIGIISQSIMTHIFPDNSIKIAEM